MPEDDVGRIKELVKLIREDDQFAFTDFYHLLYPQIYSFVFRSTFNETITEEICQETFISFWEARKNISTESYPKAYLFRIAKNLLINSSERTKKMYSLQSVEASNTAASEEINMIETDLKKAILELPERCRIIFILNRYHQFKYAEIANILDISVQTVKNQMSKSIKLIRAYLNS